MNRSARLFSWQTLIALFGAGAALVWLRPVSVPPEVVALTGPIDRIVVDKSEHRMTVYRDGQAWRS